CLTLFYTSHPPHISTLFPYTTLFRSEEALNNINIDDDTLGNVFLTGSNGFVGIHVLYELLNTTNNTIYCLVRGRSYEHSLERLRSEEHTSELQSRFDIVCRLLLERKK